MAEDTIEIATEVPSSVQRTFQVRLESPTLFKENGDPHYRLLRVTAASKEEAAEAAQRKEWELCLYELQPESLQAAVAKNAAGELRGAERARLFAHLQREPYTVVSVNEV